MRMLMKCLGVLLVLAAVALPLGFVALMVAAWYGTSETPTVVAPRLTSAQLEAGQRLLERNDPRRAREGALRTIYLTQEEADLALSVLAQRQWQGGARLALRDGEATLVASVPLPTNPFGPWLNIEAVLADSDAQPRLANLRLGRWQVPPSLATHAMGLSLRWLQQDPDHGPAADAIQRLRITPQTLAVVYRWDEETAARLQGTLPDAAEEQRLRASQAVLAAQVARTDARTTLPLHSLLQPLLDEAAQRAGSRPEALVEEQRSALVALAFYINGKGLAALAPAARDWPEAAPRRVVLAGRSDWAQNFSIAAAVAATAGTPLADAVTPYKDAQEARAGRGFSFADLAADRAGTRFGMLAVSAAPAQERLQRRVHIGLEDQDLLPLLRDLPEYMDEAEFKRRFGGPEGAGYKRMVADIERRLGALALYR